ncbi:hypothetical protein [Acrocarpospora catenulata]|uniref:hypothetical protein n=1 Tax=Acrocarpospora catenulata TaxID=2836182 RepID=UPI001BDB092E|nr:hypothetical protein [Acrocarpospora catenulata]
MTDFLVHVAVIAVVVLVGLLVWRRFAPVSFWLVVGFPVKALMIYGTWRAVASGCGLTRRRRRWRWTFPGLGG